jgi:hypothetical protein
MLQRHNQPPASKLLRSSDCAARVRVDDDAVRMLVFPRELAEAHQPSCRTGVTVPFTFCELSCFDEFYTCMRAGVRTHYAIKQACLTLSRYFNVEAIVSGAWSDTTSGHLHGALVQIEKLLRCRHHTLNCGSAFGRDVDGFGGIFQFVLDLEKG